MYDLSLEKSDSGLCIRQDASVIQWWEGSLESVSFDAGSIKEKLLDIDQHCYIVNYRGLIGVTNQGCLLDKDDSKNGLPVYAIARSLSTHGLGDTDFLSDYGVNYAYMAGSMAHGISSLKMITALGREKIFSSIGTGGMAPKDIEGVIVQIQQAKVPYALNLLFSPQQKTLEKETVNLYLKHRVRTIEASAYMDLTPHLVRYRVSGLTLKSNNTVETANRIIAKVSRKEVAAKFLMPPPKDILAFLVGEGHITEMQARLSEKLPLADDITAEADSGGHTDNRPLTCLLPSLLELRDEIQEKYKYSKLVRVGAGGGIGSPASALAAFIMGASYVVTGSINQSCIEAGICEYVKEQLAKADFADVIMAPSTDMFEMGVKVQLLKKGSLFPLRAQKLYDLYRTHASIDDIPDAEKKKLEQQILRKSISEVWDETIEFFKKRDPGELETAMSDPKKKMALIFRWYLGQSTRWAVRGEKGREIDYQIWCGPAIGAFNDWVSGSYLAASEKRSAVDTAKHIMRGAAYLSRIHQLKTSGLKIPAYFNQYTPLPFKNSI